MREHAAFIVTWIAAIAVVIVVPVIWQENPVALAASAALLLALVIALVMYLIKRRKQSRPPAKANTTPSGASVVIGDVIGAHDQAIVTRNKVNSKINIFNAPPLMDATDADG
jgi:membrane protein implicated in regulation of membrane protease activity